MKIRQCLFGAAMAVGLGLAAASAQAAPAVGSAGDLTSAVRESSNVDQVYWAAAACGTAGICTAGAPGSIMATSPTMTSLTTTDPRWAFSSAVTGITAITTIAGTGRGR